ncbi:MAG: HAD hydrolase-like protein [Methanosarcinales archaeon]|nr:HAD hydrolase-like protein [Methanosarcinales archaeon]
MPGTHGTGNRDIKGVIFDMDNTLFDFIEAKLSACNAIVDCLGAGDPDDIFGYFLSGVHDFEDWRNIENYLKDNEIYSKEMFYNCCTIYEDIKLQSIQAYPCVEETLSTLQYMGLALAIVTDAHTKNATQRLQRLHLLDSFDALVTTDIAGVKKTSPGNILSCTQYP